LLVSFAREHLAATGDALKAALEAGVTRFRPVLMTALAMIIGMAPMALGLGEGGEQNAPSDGPSSAASSLPPAQPSSSCPSSSVSPTAANPKPPIPPNPSNQNQAEKPMRDNVL